MTVTGMKLLSPQLEIISELIPDANQLYLILKNRTVLQQNPLFCDFSERGGGRSGPPVSPLDPPMYHCE